MPEVTLAVAHQTHEMIVSSKEGQRLQPRPWARLTEREKPSAAPATARVLPYILLLTTLAAAAGALVVSQPADPSSHEVMLALVLASLGVLSEFLSFRHTKSSAGSVALIPFAATILVAPNYIGLSAIVLGEVVVQVLSRRAWVKGVFNTSQFCLSLSAGILIYEAAGGVSFTLVKGLSFMAASQQLLLPSASMTAAIMFVNAVSVSGVLATTSEKSFGETFLMQVRASGAFFVIFVLSAFYLTWLSVNLGLVGTLGMAIPMLAVRQLYRTTIELSTVTEELLDLMVAAIEARDPYTSGHSKRVAAASTIIARASGLSAAEVERVGVAALLHDVGKIDEAFAPILAKEGRLTPDEWEIMKKHPVRSAELVGMLSGLKDVVAPVRHHHENWDGTGYPLGLKGDEIPLASRIIMFADTLDAITTDRPYRKALGIEEARAEFLKFKGRQFDPSICEIVVSEKVWRELYASFGSNSDSTSERLAS